MDRNPFNLIHSERIQQAHCIQFDFRRTYAAICEGETLRMEKQKLKNLF